MVTSEELVQKYEKENLDEKVTPYQDACGFSLVRAYSPGTPYSRDGMKMFIKIAIEGTHISYSVDMTKPKEEDGETSYIISDGEDYKNKVTNYFSINRSNGQDDEEEFTFSEELMKVIHIKTKKEFSLNQFVVILTKNHLSDMMFWKRKLNHIANLLLMFIFWLVDRQYEKTKTALDIYHFKRNEIKTTDTQPNIEPFFKYFFISKNILFLILLITLPSALLFGSYWSNGEFSVSNPSVILLIFLVLFSAEKLSQWLESKVKNFLEPVEDVFSKRKISFVESLHNYQNRNKFKLKV